MSGFLRQGDGADPEEIKRRLAKKAEARKKSASASAKATAVAEAKARANKSKKGVDKSKCARLNFKSPAGPGSFHTVLDFGRL